MSSNLSQLVAELGVVVAQIQKELARTPAESATTPAPESPPTSGLISKYITEAELAEWTGQSRETLQAMRAAHEGPPFVRIGRRSVRLVMRSSDSVDGRLSS